MKKPPNSKYLNWFSNVLLLKNLNWFSTQVITIAIKAIGIAMTTHLKYITLWYIIQNTYIQPWLGITRTYIKVRNYLVGNNRIRFS